MEKLKDGQSAANRQKIKFRFFDISSFPKTTKMVKLTSSDGQEFSVPREVASLSVLIKNMLEDFGEETDTPIPLPNVSGQILAKGIILYAINSLGSH